MSTGLVEELLVTDDTPKVLLLGPNRAGKTSILKVLYNKTSPHETLFLETTSKVEVYHVSRCALMRYRILDFPGNSTFDETADNALFSRAGAVAFVIDAQEEPYTEAVLQAKRAIEVAHAVNPKLTFDILIHKVDGDQFYTEETKTELQRAVHTQLVDHLQDKLDSQIQFHCTSIYDHSIYEAMSKIVQKLVPNLSVLEQCLDSLVTNSRMEKAYLFDIVSKVYIAADPHPVDLQSYELCADMLDVVIDVSCIYGYPEDPLGQQGSGEDYDGKTNCVIHLNNGTLLYLREVDKCLALVCVLREENFDRRHLLDYNIRVFKEALRDMTTTQRTTSFHSGVS